MKFVKEFTDNEYTDEDWEFFQRNIPPEKDEKPEGCTACGGPWPDCIYSCKIYDI